jgi:hypothetical protein
LQAGQLTRKVEHRPGVAARACGETMEGGRFFRVVDCQDFKACPAWQGSTI